MTVPSKVDVLRKGEEITITCNVTQAGNHGDLGIISWFLDGFPVRCAAYRYQETILPLVVRKGGNYSCVLELSLRNTLKHVVSDFVIIRCKLSHCRVESIYIDFT